MASAAVGTSCSARSGSEVDAASHSASLSTKPREPRVSLDDYFGRDAPNANEDIPGLERDLDLKMSNLPSYSDVVEKVLQPGRSRSTSRVEPREDEGRETLPDYSCSIMVQSIFHRKMEFESAVHKARDRNWYKVFVELQGTALRIYKCKSVGIFQAKGSEQRAKLDMPLWMKAGDLIKSYTLQHGDVGIAADYEKRKYVIRLRVETDQFLLSCLELPTFVTWLETLSAAIDLSPPLDERTIPREYSLPRRRRRRTENIAERIQVNDNDLVLQQREIMRTQFPHLAQEMSEEEERNLSPRQAYIRNRALSEPLSSSSSSSSSSSTPRRDASPPPALSRTTSATSSSSSLTPPQSPASPSQSSSEEGLHPSVSAETGKWLPEQTWTQQFDLLYAKRCMAVLLRKSPRKSNFLILRDKQWLIDWDSGRLQRCSPPEYGEMTLGGNWALARGGLIVKAN